MDPPPLGVYLRLLTGHDWWRASQRVSSAPEGACRDWWGSVSFVADALPPQIGTLPLGQSTQSTRLGRPVWLATAKERGMMRAQGRL